MVPDFAHQTLHIRHCSGRPETMWQRSGVPPGNGHVIWCPDSSPYPQINMGEVHVKEVQAAEQRSSRSQESIIPKMRADSLSKTTQPRAASFSISQRGSQSKAKWLVPTKNRTWSTRQRRLCFNCSLAPLPWYFPTSKPKSVLCGFGCKMFCLLSNLQLPRETACHQEKGAAREGAS